MKKFKNLLSLFMSLVLLIQVIAVPSTFGIASNGTSADSNNEKSYGAMLNAIVSKNDTYPTKYGIWVNESSQKYFLSIISNLSDQNYTVDENGYLVQEKVNNDTFNTYDEKLKELINGNKTIIVSVSETYDAYNEATNESYSIMLEDDEFTVLFDINNNCSVTILNYYHYAKHTDKFICNDEDEFDEQYFYSDAELMNKFLEVFYQKTDFVELTKDEQTQKEKDELLADDNEIPYDTPATEVISKARTYSNYSEFDAAVYGISDNSTQGYSINKIDDEVTAEEGIWIEENSREIILYYLNTHCIYTYNVDNNGYLVCDFVEKDNPNLDCQGETEIDKEIGFVLESGLSVIISVSDSYYSTENSILEKVYFSSDEYVKTFMNADNTKRIVVLNEAYFNLKMGYNLATSDRFVKNLYPQELVPQTYSSNIFTLYGETGTMNTARTVYFGPSSSDYATVGSVDNGEDIVVMGKDSGWYFIAYLVGSTTTFKSGYVPVSTVSNVSGTINEDAFYGGYNYSDSELTVQSCYLFGNAVNSGTIYSGEGFTELQQYYENNQYISLVEFSTPSGTKRGFVSTSKMALSDSKSYAARVKADSTPAYAGPDNSYVKLGGVYKNEYVSVLSTSGKWSFAEYNTTSGRKRGYILSSDLDPRVIKQLSTDKTHISLKKATKELSVYGGPNSNYALIGTIFEQEIVSYLGTDRNYSYIEYTTINGAKRGYVPTNSLTTATIPTIPNIPTYTNFSSGTYGTSGEGEPLKWYKIGSGSNVVFAVFEQHGWEDAWASDGIELVNIANTMMSKLSAMNQGNFKDWTIYVIPYANPDGITDGYTNNGPGRCTVSTKIDMNRCWPANFFPSYTSRNYTGNKSLGAPEASALKNFISNRFGSKTNIVLDIHGWLNKTYGNSQIGSYFGQQFGFSHSSSYGSGYLETWAYQQGAKSCLVEFPMPSSSSSITSNNYAGKLTNGLVNMITNISGGSSTAEGGTVVNELCKVSTNSSVNVRSGPGTSYSIVTSLTNGTKVTRIKKSVATANGYTWDKIVLENGTTGYIVTDYLVVVSSGDGYAKYEIHDDIKVIKAYLKYSTDYYIGDIDEEYDNELIGAVEEFQKAKKLTIQDGSLNSTTLIAMGFAMGTNGRVEHNSFYSKYSKVAGYYNNPISFKAVPGETTNILPERQYIFDSIETQSDSKYYSDMEREDATYNTMSSDEKQKNEKDLTETKTILDNTCEIFKNDSNLKNAYLAIQRYMDNTGKALYFEDISTMFLIEHETLKKAAFIDDCKNVAETYLNSLDSCKFALEYDFDTQISMFDDPPSNFTSDWYLACNYFKMGCNATAKKQGSTYSMTLNITTKDYYYWDDDSSPWPALDDDKFTIVLEKEVRALHLAGLAKNFEDFGCYTIKLNW